MPPADSQGDRSLTHGLVVGDGEPGAARLGLSDRQAARAALPRAELGVPPGDGELLPAGLATRPWAARQDRYAPRALPGLSDRQAARAALPCAELCGPPGDGELVPAGLVTKPWAVRQDR